MGNSIEAGFVDSGVVNSENPPINTTFSSVVLDHSYEVDPYALSDRQTEPQSIFDSYSVVNDAERLKKLAHLSPREQSYYISENILSFLEEFVARIKVKKIAGVLKDDGSMEILGVNVSDMYRYSAQLTGPGSREWYERKGLDMISKQFTEGKNRALWFSPPKMANYGFIFAFIADEYNQKIGGRPLRELLLRYDETISSCEKSTTIYDQMKERIGLNAPSACNFETPEDFLSSPLIYQHDSFEDIKSLYNAVGVSATDAVHAEVFRKKILPKIQPWIDAYVHIVQEMKIYDLDAENARRLALKNKAELLLGAIFNTAKIIHRQDNKSTAQDQKQLAMFDRSSEWDRDFTLTMAESMYRYENVQTAIIGGSNCPVTQMGQHEEQVVNYMPQGLTFGESMRRVGSGGKEVCVTCPHCQNTKHNIRLENGTYICGNPKCESNKKQTK